MSLQTSFIWTYTVTMIGGCIYAFVTSTVGWGVFVTFGCFMFWCVLTPALLEEHWENQAREKEAQEARSDEEHEKKMAELRRCIEVANREIRELLIEEALK